jgi:DNA-binding response OmpR family regulator/DNA-binding CsgD family transcriptional regulator
MSKREPRDIALVVDDSPDTLRMLTDALEQAGMTVLIARDGNQALSMIDRVTPDVVLMDAIMPGKDGFETCRRLKRIRMLTHVPVIFMTGLSETDDIVKGLEAGGVDYVTKPIDPDELLARIRVHLANARMAYSARTALDTFGRFLLATNRGGHVLWSTPQAALLLEIAYPTADPEGHVLPKQVQEWIHQRSNSDVPAGLVDLLSLRSERGSPTLEFSYIGQIGPNEILLRLAESGGNDDQRVLQQKLMLTQRESEVLLWIARGKSNRDIADILTLSPRTVNKHLEQIYTKLGVENRASAAALAVRTLSAR